MHSGNNQSGRRQECRENKTENKKKRWNIQKTQNMRGLKQKCLL